jgi:predicted nucleotidyltransferase
MQPVLKNNLPQLITILKAHKVKRAYAFGSVCTDSFNDESDIDLLVAFDIQEPFDGYAENFWSMEDHVKSLLKREVDLVPEHTLKNPYFIKVLEKTKTPLYE